MSLLETKPDTPDPSRDWDRYVVRFPGEYVQCDPSCAIWAGPEEY